MAYYSVKIASRKVQRFIFQSPKLKHMLGANSLVGELFSHDFFDLKRQGEYGIIELDFPFQKPEEFNSNKNPDNPWLISTKALFQLPAGILRPCSKPWMTQSVLLVRQPGEQEQSAPV